MVLRDYKIYAAISSVVTDFRRVFFDLYEKDQLGDIAAQYLQARAKLEGFLLLFPEGKVFRFINTNLNELLQLACCAGCLPKETGDQ